jgi:hypothetical protein
MDPVYTTDAKKVAEVESGIDIPYGPDQIVEAGNARLGPGLRALAPWMPKLAIINSVRQNSANHQSGLMNVLRCKSVASISTPTLLDILGVRRSHGEAIGSINLGAVYPTAFSPRYMGEPGTDNYGKQPGLFGYLDSADPEDLVAVAKALRSQAAPLTKVRATAAEKTTAENLLSSAELFARYASLPTFAPSWTFEDSFSDRWKDAASHAERALWLFENNLARCVTIILPGGGDFDTHVANEDQMFHTRSLATILDKLFSDLEHKLVDGRPLSAQTTIIIGSEIGRFPKLNLARGKDHFPLAPHLFYGPSFVTSSSFGATGRDMISVKTSLKSGKPDSSGHMIRVDDLGTTLLTLDGADPQLYGYNGEYLQFLVRR